MVMHILQGLGQQFTVRDVMVPRERLLCTSDEASARRLLVANDDMRVVPIESEGQLVGFVERGATGLQSIDLQRHVISQNANLIDLVESLQAQPFLFVLTVDGVQGYVHFSDLNHRLVRLTFSVVLKAAQNYAFDRVRQQITTSTLTETLDESRAKTLTLQHLAQEQEGNMDWEGLLTLEDILRLARRYDGLELTDDELEATVRVGERIDDASTPLVASAEDVAELVLVKDACFRILHQPAA